MASTDPPVRFSDRVDAGNQLASVLAEKLASTDPERIVVLGLPRGGVPVARAVADALGTTLDVILVRKLGVPAQPELAFGALGEDGVRVLNERIVDELGLDTQQMTSVQQRENTELKRRAEVYRSGRARCALEGATAVIVDDGIATGATARAACLVAQAHGAERVVLAVPVAPPSALEEFADVADEIVVVTTPQPFRAIGLFYDDFTQTCDDEVVALLDR